MLFDSINIFEESMKNGGIGEHISACINNVKFKGKINIFAIDNKFVPAASVKSTLEQNGLDSNTMLRC